MQTGGRRVRLLPVQGQQLTLFTRSGGLHRLGRPSKDQLAHAQCPRCDGSLPGRSRKKRSCGKTSHLAYLRVHDSKSVLSLRRANLRLTVIAQSPSTRTSSPSRPNAVSSPFRSSSASRRRSPSLPPLSFTATDIRTAPRRSTRTVGSSMPSDRSSSRTFGAFFSSSWRRGADDADSVLLDVGTQPGPTSIYKLWKT